MFGPLSATPVKPKGKAARVLTRTPASTTETRAANHIRALRRSSSFWRTVDDSAPPTAEKLHLWKLICAALRIPFKQDGGSLLVPVLYEDAARSHFEAVAAEGRIPPPPPPPVRKNVPAALGVLGLLYVWFGITRQWWVSWPALSVAEWNKAGALDVWQTLHGEVYRAITALTLHGDGGHLFNNLLFGAPFFVILCRRVGVGPASLLALLAGGLGNFGNVVYRVLSRSPGHVSLGFSTALFGIVGALSGIMAVREILHAVRVRRETPEAQHRLGPGLRRAFVFLAVGGAVLAMIGSDPDAKTDYAAHVFGLLGGLTCGGLYALAQDRITPTAERLMGLAALLLPIAAWTFSLLSF